mmetsp:Transcript_3823/g.5646  ORF Transcript_3823/g.5646 Transcript_3823/m.5646 type:complete len:259 (+) Transcript_3823:42-818(+)
MLRSISIISVVLATSLGNAAAFSAVAPTPSVASGLDVKSKNALFEYLKFDKNPQFDVLEKTKKYIGEQSSQEFSEDWYAADYVLRGPVIGPINRADLAKSQKGLGIAAAFPDLKLDTFGYTIDPENPYRCFYFQRWRGTHTGDLDNYGTVYPATGISMETPVSVFSVVFNPEGQVIYEQVGAVVDRLEGNTEGKAAVFGMLHTAGLKLSASPGDKTFAFIQRVGHFVGGLGRSWSKEEEIPAWWTSTSRGADATEKIE